MTPDVLLMTLAMTIERCCQESIKGRAEKRAMSLAEWQAMRQAWDEICAEHMPHPEIARDWTQHGSHVHPSPDCHLCKGREDWPLVGKGSE